MRSIRPAIAVLALASATVLPGSPPASAATVPFSDSSANGYIGLCNQAGQAVTSGSLLDDPFVWTAVSSTPAPSGYEKAKATLYVFQPRQNVLPSEWGGEQVTGSSTFTNPSHPMAQATTGDVPLVSVDGAYPPQWDGLYQLRMYFTGVNLPPYTQTYPATVIQVSGNRWSMVQGRTVPCNTGKALSGEVTGLDRSLQSPGTTPVQLGAAHGPLPGSSPSGTSGGPGGMTGAPSGVKTGSGSPADPPQGANRLAASGQVQSNGKRGGGVSDGTVAAIAMIGLAAVSGGTAGLALLRKRSKVASK